MTREEIIDGLEIYTVGRLKKDRVNITVEELQKFIDAIKALKQEPCKVGKWEYIGDNCFKCTECGEVYTMDQFNAINNYCDSRFPKGCPNCGAEMREVEE